MIGLAMAKKDGPRHLILRVMADGKRRTCREVADKVKVDYYIVRRSMYNLRRDGIVVSGGTKFQETWWQLKDAPPPVAVQIGEPRRWWEHLFVNRDPVR